MKQHSISAPEDMVGVVPRLPANRRRILALDLATNCGVAILDYTPGDVPSAVTLTIGQWDLSIGDYDSGALRFCRLYQFIEAAAPSMLAYEDVKYAGTSDRYHRGMSVTAIIARAAKPIEFIGGLKTIMATWAEVNNVPCVGYSIGTIKKHATGKGNANKMDVIKAAIARFGVDFPSDEKDCLDGGYDNMADASFIAELAFRDYAGGLKYLERLREEADHS